MKCRHLHSQTTHHNSLLCCAVLLTLCASLPAQNPDPKIPIDNSAFEAGGVLINVPAPWKQMVELGAGRRSSMDRFVPPYNRLIAAFVPFDQLGSSNGKTPDRIALVAVSRQFESKNISESDFKMIVQDVAKQFDTTAESYANNNEEEFNQKLKALDLENVKVTFDKPISLGALFSLPNAAGFGTILKVSASNSVPSPAVESSSTKALSVLFVRLKNRVVFAYIFADYENRETASWIRQASEDWCKAMLAVNAE